MNPDHGASSAGEEEGPAPTEDGPASLATMAFTPGRVQRRSKSGRDLLQRSTSLGVISPAATPRRRGSMKATRWVVAAKDRETATREDACGGVGGGGLKRAVGRTNRSLLMCRMVSFVARLEPGSPSYYFSCFFLSTYNNCWCGMTETHKETDLYVCHAGEHPNHRRRVFCRALDRAWRYCSPGTRRW